MEAPVGWQARSPPGSAGGGSWEDKRSRNMQRNQQYLAQLFADGSLDDMSASGSGNASKPGAAPGDCKTAEGVLRALQSKLRDIWAPRVASCDDVLMEVCAHCPCREVQARRLIGYISEVYLSIYKYVHMIYMLDRNATHLCIYTVLHASMPSPSTRCPPC
jgi:hypothetical protein